MSQTWQKTTLLCDRAVRLSTAKSLRILRLRIVSWKTERSIGSREEVERTDRMVQLYYTIQRIMSKRWRNNGVRAEDFPGFTTLQILRKKQNMMDEIQCDPEEFTGRIICVSMFNDIELGKERNKDACIMNSTMVQDDARKFPHGHRSFLGPGPEQKWYGTNTYKPDGQWDRVAEDMLINFR